MGGKRLLNGQPATVAEPASEVMDEFRRFLSSCSSVFHDLLRCTEESGEGRLPELKGFRPWTEALYAELNQLRDRSTFMLIQFLKASDFYQDNATISKLSKVLGERLCPAGKTTAPSKRVSMHRDTKLRNRDNLLQRPPLKRRRVAEDSHLHRHVVTVKEGKIKLVQRLCPAGQTTEPRVGFRQVNDDEQPQNKDQPSQGQALKRSGVAEASDLHHYAVTVIKPKSVLGRDLSPTDQTTGACIRVAEVQLSAHLLMGVLRNTPPAAGSNQLTRFLMRRPTPHMTVMAVLAHSPGLDAICPSDGCCIKPDLPLMTVYVDLNHDNDSGTCAGLHRAPINKDTANKGLYSLQQRKPTPTCTLHAKSYTIEDVSIELAANQCIEFGPGAWQLKGVCFKGGSVSCRKSAVTLIDCVFESCTLLALDGASAALRRVQFREVGRSSVGLSVFVSGHASQVIMVECNIKGGVQGVAVQGGARFIASHLHISGVDVVGVEASGVQSSLELNTCTLEQFSSAHSDKKGGVCKGVWVHNSATSHLYKVAIRGMCSLENDFEGSMCVGVEVKGHAQAKLVECMISETWSHGVGCEQRGFVQLEDCSCTSSVVGAGCCVRGQGSRAHVTMCRFLKNGSAGLCALDGEVTAFQCTSESNRVGYIASDLGALMKLHNCSSTKDDTGCKVTEYAMMWAKECWVDRCEGRSFEACDAKLTLLSCSAAMGEDEYVYGWNSQIHKIDCHFDDVLLP